MTSFFLSDSLDLLSMSHLTAEEKIIAWDEGTYILHVYRGVGTAQVYKTKVPGFDSW